jgi:AbrB family looped-hinge helix DNA binding protein
MQAFLYLHLDHLNTDIIVLQKHYRSEKRMETVTVSPKFQVVLPKAVRQMLGIRVGQKIVVIAYQDRIVLLPERPIQEARGSLKGIDTKVNREEDRL